MRYHLTGSLFWKGGVICQTQISAMEFKESEFSWCLFVSVLSQPAWPSLSGEKPSEGSGRWKGGCSVWKRNVSLLSLNSGLQLVESTLLLYIRKRKPFLPVKTSPESLDYPPCYTSWSCYRCSSTSFRSLSNSFLFSMWSYLQNKQLAEVVPDSLVISRTRAFEHINA